jgi:hypothetical protein
MSAHIFEPVIKELGFDVFKCDGKQKACWDYQVGNCPHYDECPRHDLKNHENWIVVKMGKIIIGTLVFDNTTVRFQSSGNHQWGKGAGALIGELKDPKTFDKISKQIKKTAIRRVPLETRDIVENLRSHAGYAVDSIQSCMSGLSHFLDSFRETVKNLSLVEKKCNKSNISFEIAAPKHESYCGLKDKINSIADLQKFIKHAREHRKTIDQLYALFAEIEKEQV